MRKDDGKSARNGSGGRLFPNSMRIISSCLKTVSSNANSVASTVRSAGASMASSISFKDDEAKDQVQWAGFDKLEIGPSSFKHVLLLGYSNGFQVVDVEDASNVRELVSKRDGPVTFLQMQPLPSKLEGEGGFRESHPLLLVVAGETNCNSLIQGSNFGGKSREVISHLQEANTSSSTVVQFYSLRSHNYVHVLRFRSMVYLVRCSARIIAIALATQIYCFDPVTLENKFSVLTYPVPLMGQGVTGVNIGYGPMAVGTRWLSYASNQSLVSNTGRLSPQNLTSSPGSSPSTSPGNGSLMARLAMESSKHLAAGLINIGDIGYKTLSKYCQDILPDGSSSPVTSNGSWKVGRATLSTHSHSTENDNVGVVVIKDFITRATVAQFRAHTSPISALCFDPSGTILVTASVHGNNINVFRIMPLHVTDDSNSVCYDWSASHVHLYKLHRGMTSAVIQDICFSSYSQWVAIVSSRGTCHIFVLSPFGGEISLCSHAYFDGSAPFLDSPIPWWLSSGSCALNIHNRLQLPPPPPLVTLSVVSRIKNGNGGWLNTVGGSAVISAVKRNAPSGALSAVFHNSVSRIPLSGPLNFNYLENLLVYSPSGHVVQYELLPAYSTATDLHYSNISPRISSGSSGTNLDEDIKVISEPVQWWDVCRRTNWPEREGGLSSPGFDEIESNGASTDCFDCDGMQVSCFNALSSEVDGQEHCKSSESLHWHLSNAEVQINSGRIPIWRTSKVFFFVMCNWADGLNFYGGEIEIEKVPVQEIKVREKDLLPVFDHFHSFQSDQSVRKDVKGRYASASAHEVINGQSAGMEGPALLPSTMIPMYVRFSHESSQMSQMANRNENSIEDRSPSIGHEVTGDGLAICGGGSCKYEKADISCLNVHLRPMSESPEAASVDMISYFGGCCKVSEADECYQSGEAAGEKENSNSRDIVGSVDHEDMPEGVFAFS